LYEGCEVYVLSLNGTSSKYSSDLVGLEGTVEETCQGEYGIHFFNFEDFGKTVFLTREDAEKALKEAKG
jgi:hypothetical protein